MSVIRSELGFLEELDDAFLVPFPGIPCAHGPSIPSPLPREVLGFVIRAIVRRASAAKIQRNLDVAVCE